MGRFNQYFHKWGIKKDHVYYLNKFEDIKRNLNEPVSDFSKRFNKIYNKKYADCKPLVIASKVRFSKAFDDYFSLMLRERNSRTLADMEIDAIEVEANRAVLGKFRVKAKKEKKNLKEKTKMGSSSKVKEEDKKIDEINSMLRKLFEKISRIITKPRQAQKNVNIPWGPYIRPFQPQIL